MTDAGLHATVPSRESDRVLALLEKAQRLFARQPAFVVRAPGRVNLIGEHTDYNGLPVLPVAIDRSILIAVAPRADRLVRLTNSDPAFPPRRYELSACPGSGPGQAGGERIAPYDDGDWGNYSKAAVQGLIQYAGSELRCGADLLVDGDIPSAAGLSSSSALVVASALALMAANHLEIPLLKLAELLPVAERYVGTLSGGMDQAASLLAHAGQALRIDFAPLRVRSVPLPADHSIVVCHSLVRAEKSGAARRAYNLRVTECRLACRVLERALGSTLPRSLSTLGDLAALFPSRPLRDFIPYLASQVPDRPLSLAEIAGLIETNEEALRAECGVTPDLGDRFALLKRARHVLSEAERVDQAESALQADDTASFGQSMNDSHASCRDDYEISCPQLEDLVHLAAAAGARGARLTGAGFGGCTVNLVPDDVLEAFLTRIDHVFYRPRLGRSARCSDFRFVLRSQDGAEIIRL